MGKPERNDPDVKLIVSSLRQTSLGFIILICGAWLFGSSRGIVIMLICLALVNAAFGLLYFVSAYSRARRRLHADRSRDNSRA